MSFRIGTDFDKATRWDRRLAIEMPFLRAWLRSWNARRVTDAACGSGRHSHALASLGFDVTGIDMDEDLLELARSESPSDSCRFLKVDLRQGAGPSGQDALFCLGNSICLLPAVEEVKACLRRFHDSLRPRGGVILHLLNYERFRNPDNTFFPLKTDLGEDGQPVRHFLKGITVCADTARVQLVDMRPDETGTWKRSVKHDSLLALEAGLLQEALADAGFVEIQVYGGFNGSHYHANESHDIVICARRK